MPEATIVSAGIDYITATIPKDHTEAQQWYYDCLQYINTLATDGNEVKHTKRLGYEGLSIGGSFTGIRDDGILCQISGERAQTGFTTLYRPSLHFSRIDVQCTIRTPNPDALNAERARDAIIASNAKLSSARQRNATLIEDLRGGATCYIGSRTSAQFSRIYNKEVESKDDKYKQCWRYEVELHNALANETAKLFVKSEYTQSQQAAVFVRQWLKKRGVNAPWRAEVELYALPSETNVQGDTEARLKWLRMQVRPTLRRLIKLGLRASILEALGLEGDDTDSV